MPEAPEVQPGERWTYRARRIDDLVEVEVIKIGTQKPARVQVRFVDERFEGRQEWVPPARLNVHRGRHPGTPATTAGQGQSTPPADPNQSPAGARLAVLRECDALGIDTAMD